MKNYIDNIPKKENNKESKNTNLGETEVKMNTVKPIDSNHTFQSINFDEVSFPTSITTNDDENTYDVLADKNDKDVIQDDNETDKEPDNSDEESVDIDGIFKDHINIAFVSTLSIVGLFILFRMFQKSR